MSIRAVANKKFLLKYVFIALACIAFGLWSIYDGLIGYPKKLPKAEAYAEISELAPTERSKRWQVISKENGWSPGLPDTPEVIEGKIMFQFFMAGVTGLVGIPLLIWYFKTRNTYVELDGERVRASWGPEFDLGSVNRVDKSKWSKKGIAKLEIDGGNSTSKFKLDDFMYSREEVGEILRAVEARLSPNQIVGGEPEKTATTGVNDGSVGNAGDD